MTEDVFSQIKKSGKGKRGKGLSAPPTPEQAGRNVEQPEHTPAVQARAPRRSYRVSTYIFEDAGERLEQLILALRRKEGRKVKIAEALERAIDALEQKENVKTE